MKLRHWLFTLVALLAPAFATFGQEVGIKTNLLGWAVTNPNIGVEIGAGHHSTISLTGALNPWNFSDDRHLKSWIVMPEYRYWFCERFSGHFLGIHLLGGQYNAKNVNFPLKPLIIAPSVEGAAQADIESPGYDGKGWPDLTSEANKGRHAEGWFGGAGITYGYQWMLSKHWNLEASLGVGYAYSKLTFYGRCARTIDKRTLHYVGPTHANLSFIYLF